MDIRELKRSLRANVEGTKEIQGVQVIPFMSLPAIDELINEILKQHTVEDKEMILLYGVLANCTEIMKQIEDDEFSTDITYAEFVYSGFFDEILNKCPRIKEAVDRIRAEVERRESFQYVLNSFMESAIKTMQKANQNINGDTLTQIVDIVNSNRPEKE